MEFNLSLMIQKMVNSLITNFKLVILKIIDLIN